VLLGRGRECRTTGEELCERTVERGPQGRLGRAEMDLRTPGHGSGTNFAVELERTIELQDNEIRIIKTIS